MLKKVELNKKEIKFIITNLYNCVDDFDDKEKETYTRVISKLQRCLDKRESVFQY